MRKLSEELAAFTNLNESEEPDELEEALKDPSDALAIVVPMVDLARNIAAKQKGSNWKNIATMLKSASSKLDDELTDYAVKAGMSMSDTEKLDNRIFSNIMKIKKLI